MYKGFCRDSSYQISKDWKKTNISTKWHSNSKTFCNNITFWNQVRAFLLHPPSLLSELNYDRIYRFILAWINVHDFRCFFYFFFFCWKTLKIRLHGNRPIFRQFVISIFHLDNKSCLNETYQQFCCNCYTSRLQNSLISSFIRVEL